MRSQGYISSLSWTA